MKSNQLLKQGLAVALLCFISAVVNSMNPALIAERNGDGQLIGIQRPVPAPVAFDPDVLSVHEATRRYNVSAVASDEEAQNGLSAYFSRMISEEQGLLSTVCYAQEKEDAMGVLRLTGDAVDTVYNTIASTFIRRLHLNRALLQNRNVAARAEVENVQGQMRDIRNEMQNAQRSAKEQVALIQRELCDALVARRLAEEHIQAVQQAQAQTSAKRAYKGSKKRRGIARKPRRVLKKRSISKRKQRPARRRTVRRRRVACVTCNKRCK